MARAGRAGLGAVDLDLGGVEVDRRLRLRIAPKRPVKASADPGQRPLDRLHLAAPKAPRELAGGRRRRDAQRGPQSPPGPVGAQVLEVVEALAAVSWDSAIATTSSPPDTPRLRVLIGAARRSPPSSASTSATSPSRRASCPVTASPA